MFVAERDQADAREDEAPAALLKETTPTGCTSLSSAHKVDMTCLLLTKIYEKASDSNGIELTVV